MESTGRRTRARRVLPELVTAALPEAVKMLATSIFTDVSARAGGKPLRCKKRSGLIFASVFEAYKRMGRVKHPNDLDALLHLNHSYSQVKGKVMHYTLSIQNSKSQCSYTSPLSLLPDILSKVSVHVPREEVIPMYVRGSQGSRMMHSSKPYNVMVAVVYYHLMRSGEKEAASSLLTQPGMCSPATIRKLHNELSLVLEV